MLKVDRTRKTLAMETIQFGITHTLGGVAIPQTG